VRISHSRITSADVGGRADVDRLRSTDVNAALHRARQIQHPWYRCQALSSVAEVQRSSAVALSLLKESLSAAHEQDEPNRIVSVASWPLRQLVSLDLVTAKTEVKDLLRIISTEPHGLRRLDGLSRIIIAVAASSELLDIVKPAFVAACGVSEGWRTERTVAFVALFLARRDSKFALDLLSGREANRFRVAALKSIHAMHGQQRV